MLYITGGRGRLGCEVAKLLPRGRIVERGDPLVFPHATAVLHLAGSLNFNDPRELWNTNVELTRRVIASIPCRTRLVFTSSISVYGKQLARLPADENTPCYPDSPYARSKYEAEKLVLQRPNSVALRIGPLYGPRFEEYFQFIHRIERGRIFILGSGKNHIPFTHAGDAARAIVAALHAPPGMYIVAGPPIPQQEAYRLAAHALGVAPPYRYVPSWLARIFFPLSGLTDEHFSILTNDRMFNCARAKKYLAFRPRSFQEGLEEMVRLYRSVDPQKR